MKQLSIQVGGLGAGKMLQVSRESETSNVHEESKPFVTKAPSSVPLLAKMGHAYTFASQRAK